MCSSGSAAMGLTRFKCDLYRIICCNELKYPKFSLIKTNFSLAFLFRQKSELFVCFPIKTSFPDILAGVNFRFTVKVYRLSRIRHFKSIFFGRKIQDM